MMKKQTTRLRLRPDDSIPIRSELRLLSDNLVAKGRPDIIVLNQAQNAPSASTHKSASRLYRKTAADIGQDEAATAKDALNVNSSSLQKISAEQITRIKMTNLPGIER
jgi:hypothetical protein